MKTTTPFDFINELWERGMDASVTDEGRLFIAPSDKITDTDRTFIRANREKLIALVRGGQQLGHLADGWQHDEAMSERVILVRNGRLIDSSLFHTAAGAQELVRRMQRGEPLNLAVAAACAFEDARAKQTT